MSNIEKEYIYPEIKKTVLEEENTKTFTLTSTVRISVNNVYYKVLMKQQTIINKEIHNTPIYDNILFEIIEKFNVEVYKCINFHEEYKEPLKNYIDDNQISEKERLKLKYN